MFGLDMFRTELVSLDDSGALQQARVYGYAGEELTGVHRVQPFGFSSIAPPGSHGIGLALRGERTLAATLGLEHPAYRPKGGAVGGATLYDMWGNTISLTQNVKTISHSSKIVLKVGSMIVAISANRIDLGADPAPHAVQTVDGPSTKVFAVL